MEKEALKKAADEMREVALLVETGEVESFNAFANIDGYQISVRFKRETPAVKTGG